LGVVGRAFEALSHALRRFEDCPGRLMKVLLRFVQIFFHKASRRVGDHVDDEPEFFVPAHLVEVSSDILMGTSRFHS
jgi:hypothetical protein